MRRLFSRFDHCGHFSALPGSECATLPACPARHADRPGQAQSRANSADSASGVLTCRLADALLSLVLESRHPEKSFVVYVQLVTEPFLRIESRTGCVLCTHPERAVRANKPCPIFSLSWMTEPNRNSWLMATWTIQRIEQTGLQFIE